MSTFVTALASILVIGIFLGMSIFQLLLALGKPYGKLAYAGKYEVLPTNYRIMSMIAIAIFLVATFFVLVNMGVIPAVRFGRSIRIPVVALQQWLKEYQKAGTSKSSEDLEIL